MDGKKCPRCGYDVEDDWTVCPKCRLDLEPPTPGSVVARGATIFAGGAIKAALIQAQKRAEMDGKLDEAAAREIERDVVERIEKMLLDSIDAFDYRIRATQKKKKKTNRLRSG